MAEKHVSQSGNSLTRKPGLYQRYRYALASAIRRFSLHAVVELFEPKYTYGLWCSHRCRDDRREGVLSGAKPKL
jgi:hypothetical protein